MDHHDRRSGSQAANSAPSIFDETAECLRLALDAAAMGWWNWDLTTGKMIGDARTKALFGLPPDGETTFAEYLAAVHPEDRPAVEACVAHAIASPGDYQSEFRAVRPDGQVRWILINGRSITEGSDKPVRLVGVVQDITQRKATEDTLRQREADLNRAQAVAHTGSWRLDVQRNQLYWSEETHRIFGVPRETRLTYEMFLAIVHPDDREVVDRAWRVALGGLPYQVEHRICVGEQVKWVRETAELEFDSHGTLLGGFGTVQDITDRKQAEEELRQAREELEWRVDERTAELARANEELRALNTALAQRAEQLQSLAAQLAQAEEKERRRLARVLHDHLQQLLAAARIKLGPLRHRQDASLLPIVDDVDGLLNQAIAESQALTVELSPPVLYDRGLAAGLEWLAQRMAEKFDLPVRLEVESESDARDEGSRGFLFEVVRELLFNVVKHARARSAHVRLTRTDDQRFRVEVADDGIGWDPAQRQEEHGHGGGFGLFSIRERLRLLGGSMEVDGRPGAGTRVIVVLPPPP